MKILIRLSLVLGSAVLLLFLVIWGSLILNTRKAQQALSTLELNQVEHWQIHWDEQEYRLRLATDWAFLKWQQSTGSKRTLEQELLAHIESAGIYWLAIADSTGAPTLLVAKNDLALKAWLSLAPRLSQDHTDNWYTLIDGDCWQIYRHEESPTDTVLWAGRPLAGVNLHAMEHLANATIRFAENPAGNVSMRTASYGASVEGDTLVYRQPLSGAPGHIALIMEVEWRSSLQELFIAFYKSQINSIIFFCLIIQVVVFLSLYRWVVGPVSKITTAFKNRNSEPLVPLRKDGSELGLLARIVADFFRQKDELEQEVSERLQTEASLRESESLLKKLLLQRETLAHNLHDGIVQSLYATGLKLQMLRQKYRHSTPEVALEIQQTCDQLNTIMRDVRSYLNDLEPAALEGNDLESALHQLLNSLPLPEGCSVAISFPEGFSENLSRTHTVELFHCLHELCTNAIKHSKPTRISIAASWSDGLATIAVVNDGGVFNPPEVQAVGTGKGLRNITSRMSNLNGQLILPYGEGTPVICKLQFPLK